MKDLSPILSSVSFSLSCTHLHSSWPFPCTSLDGFGPFVWADLPTTTEEADTCISADWFFEPVSWVSSDKLWWWVGGTHSQECWDRRRGTCVCLGRIYLSCWQWIVRLSRPTSQSCTPCNLQHSRSVTTATSPAYRARIEVQWSFCNKYLKYFLA